MKILKAQSGVVYTPEIRDVYVPSQQATTSAGSTSSSTSEKMDDMTKEILSTLDTNGIPIDVEVFGQYMSNLLGNARNMYSTGSTSHTIQQLIALKGLANKVSYSKALGEGARKRLASENTGSDIALTSNGYLYAKTEDGELTAIDPDTYYKNKDEYELLNNNELLHLRETTSALAMNTSILNDLNNSVGMKAVMDQIVGIIQKFGENKSTAYTQKQGQSIQKGLEALMSGGPDGYYRVTTSTDKGTSQDDIAEAIAYLYRNLTANAKNTLRANVAANGANPDSAKGVAELLQKALYFNTSSDIDVNYDKSASESKKTASGSESSKLNDKLGYGKAIASGYGANTSIIIRTSATDSSKNPVNYTINGKRNLLKNADGKNVSGVVTAKEAFDMLHSHGLATDGEQLYFGDNQFSRIDGDKLLINADKGMVTVDVPVDHTGRPDFDAANNLQEAREYIQANNITNPLEVREVYWRFGLNNFDVAGNLKTQRFLTFDTIMSEDDDDIFGGQFSDLAVVKMKDSSVRSEYRRKIEDTNQTRDKKNRVDKNLGHLWDRGILYSQVFIPMQSNEIEFALQDERVRTDKASGYELQQFQETYVDPQLTETGVSMSPTLNGNW